MSRSLESAVAVCSGLTFSWPDGTAALRDLDVVVNAGRTGLVGANGSGKSTLLRLIAGVLTPERGTLTVSGDVGYLPQDVTLHTGDTLADLLGIATIRAAVLAVEAGDVEALADVGDDGWDVEERATAELARHGLPVDLDRAVATLSGGETVLAALVGLLVRRPAITLLDEPTNNLDACARERLYAAVERWPGALLVVSHDRELLERVDRIAELRDGAIRVFGGPLSAYEQTLAAEQEAAQRQVRTAEAEVRREQRQLEQARIVLARRERYGRRASAEKREPKVIMNERKRQAQVSGAKHRIRMQHEVDQARAGLDTARGRVRDDDEIRIELPDTAVPAGRTVLQFERHGVEYSIRGPERVALVGPNGSGKTTLLRAILGASVPGVVTRPVTVPVGYLPQRITMDDDATVLQTVLAGAPGRDERELRWALARFLFTEDRVTLPTSALSGGERFRLALARLLLTDPAPRLLLLDEPTNNLDFSGVEHLADALGAYRGALVVASHDRDFLDRVGVDHTWEL